MNLFPTRASAFGGGLVACVLIAATLTGCSAGQQSQTSIQESAVNGASGGVGTIALRDVRIRAQVTGAALQPGESVDLLFVAVNESLGDTPETINEDPYGEGWLVKVKLSDPGEQDALLDSTAYEATLS